MISYRLDKNIHLRIGHPAFIIFETIIKKMQKEGLAVNKGKVIRGFIEKWNQENMHYLKNDKNK
jgi:hypothetical protein